MQRMQEKMRDQGLIPATDEEEESLQKLRDKTLYEYMSNLVSTAKIELQAQFKQQIAAQ